MIAALRTPFGVDWEGLVLDQLLAFLAEPVDESLTWEAKGGDIRPEHIHKSASAFGNSELGGVLVLGVTQDRQARTWAVGGWTPPMPEVDLWISHCLRGVDPRPSADVKHWPLPDGGALACVAIWPVSVPPVLTASGQVWERTSSESVKVTNPTDLRRLFERGRAAEARIYHLSNDAASDLIAAPRGVGCKR